MKISFPFDQDLQRIFFLLKNNCRLVGGCVRDYILFDKLVEDIDIATPYLVDEIISLLEPEFVVLKTGIQHGTVTIVGENKYEITTLRNDDFTNGRHAIVSFHNSYEQDSQRRDFTINALYCDVNGEIYDYCNGLTDLKLKKIKFIGDAYKRIEEDYLRILRFFRFSFRFGNIEKDDLQACYDLKDGLLKISYERITQEWFKIINSAYFWQFIDLFKTIMDVIQLKIINDDLSKYKNLSSLGLTALFIKNNSLLCLSNAQKKYINLLKSSKIESTTDITIFYNKFGKEFIQDLLILLNISNFELIQVANCPVNGNDIIALGYDGQQIGTILKFVEHKWYEMFGNISKEDLLKVAANYGK